MNQRMTVQEARSLNLLPQSQPQKQSKYRNHRTFYEGKWFDSKKEAQRAFELDVLCKTGEVVRYETQYVFPIEHNGLKICKYIADFKVEWADGSTTYEDVKGVRTSVFVLKKKLVRAFYGIEIIEI